MIGAFVFILIQLVLIVDLAYAWNGKLLDKAEEGNGNKAWYYGKLDLMTSYYHIVVTKGDFNVFLPIFSIVSIDSALLCYNTHWYGPNVLFLWHTF